MFIEKTNSRGKYTCYLLRETYREYGKVKHRTIANLSHCSDDEIAAMRLALKHKNDLTELTAISEVISLRQGLSVGAVWLNNNQAKIEDRLFRSLYADKKPGLYLYDVTSSYLEGQYNELSAFGYNRDGKKGKRQIVIGLLCDYKGRPLSIEVFAGNTQDTVTVASQIKKIADRFGGGPITFVGDRGMLKSRQIEDITEYGFHYITAITKPQIESLLDKGVIQMNLFDQHLAEVETEDGIRYVLRRNPERAAQIKLTRESKLTCLEQMVTKQNAYLAEHRRASVDVSLRKINQRCEKLKVSKWVKANASERRISLSIEKQALAEIEKLDGCYVLKTDLNKKAANKETIHCRYKDLAHVEWAFRTSKTVQLELRPVNVRLASRTRGHAFVVMLAYRIVQELANRWNRINLTVQEGIDELKTLCAMEILVAGKTRCNKIPY